MEKLQNKKFDQSQIISDNESQSLFGGKQYGTRVTSGQNAGKRDSWNDANDNRKYDKGDTLIIYGMVVPPTPDEEPMDYTNEELIALEVEVIEEP